MRRAFVPCLLAILALASPAAAENWKSVTVLKPAADTWATHDDMTVHGFEETMKVGHEPQGCQTGVLGYDPCPKAGKVCCKPEGDFAYNYCALEWHCESTTPEWEASRSFRGYLKFDLSALPAGTVMSATLRLRQAEVVEEAGGPLKIVVTRLKNIEAGGCAWTEASLNDTNLTTWSSLPQNLSKSPDGFWSWDVTKAVRDWVNGDADLPDKPIAPNCGFHLYDPDYPKSPVEPLIRWARFHTKESGGGGEMAVTIAKDLDGDGYAGDLDCDETAAAVNPGAPEVCDGIDNDCSGGTDDEVCDGADNDCDGSTDEGELGDLCGPGLVCVSADCVKSCEDDCDSAWDLECRELAPGVWQVLHCRHTDEDACMHLVPVENCPDGWYCEFGHCSKNCVDEFDCEAGLEGTVSCQKDLAGRWFVMTCGNHDSDECLEWGDAEPCGKGAGCSCTEEGTGCTDPDDAPPDCDHPCVAATCGTPCTDECLAGERKCSPDGKVAHCWDFDDDPCWEWGGEAACADAGATCHQGVCSTPCDDDCEDGAKRCIEHGGQAGVETCGNHDADPCRDWGAFVECAGECGDGACVTPCEDECLWAGATACADGTNVRTCADGPDGCLHWGAPEACPHGCKDQACAAAPEPTPENADEAAAEPAPDAALPDVPVGPETAADVPAEGTSPADVSGDGGAKPDQGTGGGSGSSGGCNAAGAGGAWIAPLLLAVPLLRRRRARTS
ncbi:MAG: putative metal-binding motif-containing protein [Deltaproteobacteria bacterium]|nr:putative metal-binding motif-containing protein [Deltaproteobacteria bacterium]